MAQYIFQSAYLILKLLYALRALLLLVFKFLKQLLDLGFCSRILCHQRVIGQQLRLILILCILRVEHLILVGELQLLIGKLQLLVGQFLLFEFAVHLCRCHHHSDNCPDNKQSKHNDCNHRSPGLLSRSLAEVIKFLGHDL